MSKQFWAVIIGIVLIFGGIIALSSDKTEDNGGSGSKLTQHVRGNGTSGVTLVEYGDYQCPHCQAYEPTVRAIQAEFNDEIKFQFRNFPISTAHANAFAAARAAEAADFQGKFWEMHDLLYENQDPNGKSGWAGASNPNTFFDSFAKQLGLDVAKFKADFASSKVNDRINADMAEGTKLEVTGTPAFFLDGKKVEIANDPAAFRKLINEAIAKKKPAAKTETTTQTPAAQPAQ